MSAAPGPSARRVLEPCPFCGSGIIPSPGLVGTYQHADHVRECIIGDAGILDTAAWNRRAAPDRAAMVEFVKQEFGGATVATILETDDSVVEVMERNDGTYELIVHARRSEHGEREDLSARLKPEHFDLLGSVAKRMRARSAGEEKDHG